MPGKPIPRWLSIAILLAIATVFGSNHIAARIAFDHGVNITTAVAARSIGASLFVGVLLLVSRVPLALPAATRWRAVVGGALIAVQSYCIYSAVARIPVALALSPSAPSHDVLPVVVGRGGSVRPARALFAMPVALCGLRSRSARARAAMSPAAGPGSAPGVALRGAARCPSPALFLTSRWLKEVDGRLRTL